MNLKVLETTNLAQYLILVSVESFEKLAEVVSELMQEGYFINQVTHDKTHSEEKGTVYKALILATDLGEVK